MTNGTSQNNNDRSSCNPNSSTSTNRPDMSDWDRPAGNEELRLSELRKSFRIESDENKPAQER